MNTPNKAAQCASPNNSKSPAGVCPLKNKNIAIVPVRYALDEPFAPPQKQLHPLPAGAGFMAPLKFKESGYALRQLRDGWLYVYLITHDPQPASRADMASEGLPRLHAPIQPTCS